MTISNTISINELISFIGLTEARIGQLVKDNVIVKVSRGTYNFKRSVSNYCEYQRSLSRKTDEVTDEKYQRTRYMAARADIAELDADERAGNLVRRNAVEEINNKVAVTLNVNLMGIADRVSSLVAASTSGDECHHLINSEVRKSLDSCLNALSKIEVDDALLDVTRKSAQEALEKHEEKYRDFVDPNDGG